MSISPYIKIAREAIQSHFNMHTIDKHSILEQYPQMSMKKATFVTLTLNGQLRGCIGSLIAHRPLIDDLISNAQSAAFHDPRFSPLTLQEFNHTHIEVSLLSEPKQILYTDETDLQSKINVNEDGVILQLGNNYQATFLPQVWEELNDFESFFAHLGMKAGIGSSPLVYHPEIFTYQVEKIKEQ
ncbi:MAG: AmmeMemoRadiSam system protein A [Sulfuricurvum sp.]|nr:AmmeMemoRadiSam system protein A [Sulfuricurvum sp.]MDP3022779.1 AmmeMemoRadiSam system protein A [Sulfuricurvum sp.]